MATPLARLQRPARVAFTVVLSFSIVLLTCPSTAGRPTPLLEAISTDVATLAGVGGTSFLFLAESYGDSVDVIVAGDQGLARTGRLAPAMFPIGSLTKSFLAALVVLLHEDGTLHLDDSAAEWLPGLLCRRPEVTIRDLLNHTARLPDYMDIWLGRQDGVVLRDAKLGRHWTPVELVQLALREGRDPLAPGPVYSNTHALVVGLLVEAATGEDLGQLLTSRILVPLGLEHTMVPRDPLVIGDWSRSLAPSVVRCRPARGAIPLPLSVHLSLAGAAGGMVSSAEDVAHFFTALLNGKLVSGDGLRQMLDFEESADGGKLGLGLMLFNDGGVASIGHDGSIAGCQTAVRVSLSSATTYVEMLTPGAHELPVPGPQAHRRLREKIFRSF